MVSLAAFTVSVLTGTMAPYRELCSPPLGYQTIDTRGTKKLEFPKNIILGRRKGWILVQAERTLSLGKRFHIFPTALTTAVPDSLEPTQYWANDRWGLAITTIAQLPRNLILYLYFTSRLWRWIWGKECQGVSLFVPFPNGHIVYLLFLCFALTYLFNWPTESEWQNLLVRAARDQANNPSTPPASLYALAR